MAVPSTNLTSAHLQAESEMLLHNRYARHSIIHGSAASYCIQCIRPHIIEHCNGTKITTYRQCPVHVKLAHIASDPTFADKNLQDVIKDRIGVLDVNRYDEIRQDIGDEKMALQLQGHHDLEIMIVLMEQHDDDWRGHEIRMHVEDTVKKMLEPTKIHVRGCLHSKTLEVIMCKRDTDSREAGTVTQDRSLVRESPLATCLYFRRCDGVFKNIKGEILERTT